MLKAKTLIICILFLSFPFVFFAFYNLISAQEPPPDACTEGPCCNTAADPNEFYGPTQSCNSWTEYGCYWGTGCGNDVRYQTFTQRCSGDSPDCTGSIVTESEGVADDCQSWEVCSPGSSSCSCAGSCLATPTNPSPSNNEQNVKLPVTLNWNLVDGANSYRYKIEGVIPETATTSTQIPIDEEGACLLKSSTTYDWGVTACCSVEGTNCGDWSNWSLQTSLAPQPITPLDLDREGPEKAEDVSLAEKLKWCPIEDPAYYPETYPRSYRYLVYLIQNETEDCHPLLKTNEDCRSEALLPEYLGIYYPPPEFSLEGSPLFTKQTSYAWQVTACKDPLANNCTDWSQKWQFTIASFDLTAPTLLSPSNDPLGKNLQGFPVTLSWAEPTGANSYRYSLYKVTPDGVIIETLAEDEKVSSSILTFDYPVLSLDTFYSWKVRPCWDYESENCQENAWSELYTFKTTGRPPKLETMKPEGENIPIPANFKWGKVPGAESYRIKVWGNGLDLEKPVDKDARFSLDYPDLKQERNYSWQIKTCARERGEVCWGDWPTLPSKSFKTFKLGEPSNPSPNPEEDGKIYTYESYYVSWKAVEGAKFYQYAVDYINLDPQEKNEGCQVLVGQKIVQPTIIGSTSAPLSLECLGEYQWTVRACLNENCDETGDWSPLWHFNFTQLEVPGKGGLVPCGRTYDHPDTPWNERERCEFKHLFILLRNIIDFLLWRLGLIALGLLAVATGVIYYFSMGAPAVVINIRAIWRAAGIGYGIIFLAWIIINLIVAILGYQVTIFGPWWEIKL